MCVKGGGGSTLSRSPGWWGEGRGLHPVQILFRGNTGSRSTRHFHILRGVDIGCTCIRRQPENLGSFDISWGLWLNFLGMMPFSHPCNSIG